ncbi:ribbon-helix-helix domain-containing protein [Pannonibacter sp.]|uniref:ribbon-helix-helix domain-containing protein n=1 Tax=Pannonibacter sp. TaxID=1906786 RepID=UPI003F700B81
MTAQVHNGKAIEALLSRLLATGRYATADDALLAGLTLLAERELLRSAIQDGIASGSGIPADEVFTRLKRKYASSGSGPQS